MAQMAHQTGVFFPAGWLAVSADRPCKCGFYTLPGLRHYGGWSGSWRYENFGHSHSDLWVHRVTESEMSMFLWRIA